MSLIFKRFITWVGKVKPEDVKAMSGQDMMDGLIRVTNEIEAEHPEVKQAKIKGALKHKSHYDLSDTKDVISVTYMSENGTKVMSTHIHEDGTYSSKHEDGTYSSK